MTSATQILWIDLLTDSGPRLALGMEQPDRGVMQAPPRDPRTRTRVIGAGAWIDIVLAAVVMAAGTLLAMTGPESRAVDLRPDDLLAALLLFGRGGANVRRRRGGPP